MSRAVATDAPCPCGSGTNYGTCCARLHAGAEPSEPRELVRARYSAFSMGLYDYVLRTVHSSHAEARRPSREVHAVLQKLGRTTRYKRLTIIDASPADADGVARVLFAVELMQSGRDGSFVELSSFAAEHGGWRYVAGITVHRAAMGVLPTSIADFEARAR